MTTEFNQQKRIEKIQKLLALAEDNTNQAQAAEAARKAQELMQTWLIEESLVKTVAGQPAPKMGMVDVKYLGDRKTRWEDTLCVEVAAAFLVHPFHRDWAKTFCFAGRQDDAELAAFTFETLRRTIERMSRAALSEHGAEVRAQHGYSIYNPQQCRSWSNCHPTVYRSRWLTSWLEGAVSAIGTRLQQQSKTFETSSSTALMVVETRKEQAEGWAKEEFRLGASKAWKPKLQFVEAHEQGVQAGRTVEITKGIEGPEKPKQLK